MSSSIRLLAFALTVGVGPILASSGLPRAAQAATVEAFVIAVGGQTQPLPGFSCTTYGPATPALAFFASVAPAIPIDGLANCGIAGGFRTTTTSSLGPVSDATSLTTAFAQNSFDGRSLALARAGGVLAEAHGSFTGPSNAFIVEGAASYATFEDTLTVTSPGVLPGASGAIRLRFTVAGSLAVAGPPPFNSVADVEVNYRVAGGGSFILMRAQANRSDLVPFATTGTGAPLTGFTLAPGSFAGSDQISSLNQSITWGTPFSLKFGVLTSAIPGSGATADVDFTGGVTLTGIELFANGLPVGDFSISAESGTTYGPNGVPEPARSAMIAIGTLGVAWSGRRIPRRRRARSARAQAKILNRS